MTSKLEVLKEAERITRQECKLDANYDALKQLLDYFMAENDLDGLVDLIRYLTERRDIINASFVIFLGAAYENTKLPWKHSGSAAEFYQKMIDALAGKVAFEKFIVLFANEILSLDEVSEELRKNVLSIQAETFTNVDNETLSTFLLNQYQIALKLNDNTRASVLDKNLNPAKIRSHLTNDKFAQLLLLKIQLRLKLNFEQDNCIDYLKNLSETTEDSIFVIAPYVICLAIENYKKRVDLLRKVASDFVAESKIYSEMYLFFSDHRISFHGLLEPRLIDLKVTKLAFENLGPKFTTVFELSSQKLCSLWERAVIEHNIFVISQFYSEISLDRMATFCGIEEASLFRHICELIPMQISASIDAKTGFVKFNNGKTPTSHKSSHDLMSICRHRIHKEDSLQMTRV